MEKQDTLKLSPEFDALWRDWLNLTTTYGALLTVLGAGLVIVNWKVSGYFGLVIWCVLLASWLGQQAVLLRRLGFLGLPAEQVWQFVKEYPEWQTKVKELGQEVDSTRLTAQAQQLLVEGLATGYLLGWARCTQLPPVEVLTYAEQP